MVVEGTIKVSLCRVWMIAIIFLSNLEITIFPYLIGRVAITFSFILDITILFILSTKTSAFRLIQEKKE